MEGGAAPPRRARTSLQNLEAGVADTIGLGAPPGSVRGQPKNVSAVQASGLVNQLDVASWKHPGRSPPSESTLQAADLVEGKRRAGPTSSVVARIYSQLEEQRVEHEHDNVEDEDRGVDARCPHGSYSTGWD